MDFTAEVMKKYTYLDKIDVDRIVNKAKMYYYLLSYPCGGETIDETTKPITGFIAENWVLAACDELIERLGFNSVIGYRENGVQWTFDNAGLSDRLCSMIKGHICTFKE